MRPNYRRCPTCKADLPSQRLRGGFSALLDPPLIFYHGERLRLTPAAARVLTMLAAQKFVSKEELRSSVANDRILNVHLTTIRHVLPAGVELHNDFGKGYRLDVPRR